MSDGTGIVHIAPRSARTTTRVGRKYNLPFVQLVDARGLFVPAARTWPGVFVKDGDKIIAGVTGRGDCCIKAPEFEHSYPFCWRCDTPLMYYARQKLVYQGDRGARRLIAATTSVHWMPETIKEGRMGNFLENVIDWGLSRDRYWGTPLPVWVCKSAARCT